MVLHPFFCWRGHTGLVFYKWLLYSKHPWQWGLYLLSKRLPRTGLEPAPGTNGSLWFIPTSTPRPTSFVIVKLLSHYQCLAHWHLYTEVWWATYIEYLNINSKVWISACWFELSLSLSLYRILLCFGLASFSPVFAWGFGSWRGPSYDALLQTSARWGCVLEPFPPR